MTNSNPLIKTVTCDEWDGMVEMDLWSISTFLVNLRSARIRDAFPEYASIKQKANDDAEKQNGNRSIANETEAQKFIRYFEAFMFILPFIDDMRFKKPKGEDLPLELQALKHWWMVAKNEQNDFRMVWELFAGSATEALLLAWWNAFANTRANLPMASEELAVSDEDVADEDVKKKSKGD